MASVLPLIFLLVIIYLFGILPRRRQAAKHARMIRELRVNDVVVTSGGVRGRVIALGKGVVTVEAAPGVRLEIEPKNVESLVEKGATEEQRTCPRCGATVGAAERFCGTCFQPLFRAVPSSPPAQPAPCPPGPAAARRGAYCARCRSPLPPGAAFCGQCGAPARLP